MLGRDGPFNQQGREYEPHERLQFCLWIDGGVRLHMSISRSVAAEVDLLIRLGQQDKANCRKIIVRERAAAIEAARRNYYRWRDEFIAPFNAEATLREDFGKIGLKVETIETRENGCLIEPSHNELFAPPPKPGRPRTPRA